MAQLNVEMIDFNLVYYLSGPMTGIEEYNYPAFETAAVELRDVGLKIESPHENEWPENAESLSASDLWVEMMARAQAQVARSQGVILLSGWAHSSGALRELGWAKERKLPVYYLDDNLVLYSMNRTV